MARFTQGGFYADALAGYAYYDNQLQRQILIPGLQQRTANGSTGANQFLGQVEAGYRLGVYAPAAGDAHAVRPPAGLERDPERLHANGAPTRSTSTWRSRPPTRCARTLGADLGGAIGARRRPGRSTSRLRLGWHARVRRHRPADHGGLRRRAVGNAFTVYGATPQRDAAVIGFLASTSVAAATQLYLRYDGEIGTGTDNHALNLGVRMTW